MTAQMISMRAAALLLAACAGLAAVPLRAADGADDAADARIQSLIQQLGHRSYASREKAQAELSRLGLAAFDALLDAQESDQVEVALRARYLVRGMNIGWVREEDPAEVKAILRGYEAAGSDHRRSIMERLALEDDERGTDALCRLARFETDEVLSKKAALVVMLHELPEERAAIDERARGIRAAIGGSRRTGAEWLRTYVSTLEGREEAIAALDGITRSEQEAFSLTPDRTSAAIVGDLLLWQAGVLRDHGRSDEAFAVIVRRLDLLDDQRTVVMETLDWLIHRQAWTLVDEITRRLGTRLDKDAEYLYRLAEARLKQGQLETAEALAKRAFELEEEDTREHKRVGLVLQTRGMFPWAEREYRYSMEKGPPGSLAHVESYLYLSEMLHDVENDMAAATALQGLVDLAKKDDTVMQQISRRRGNLATVESRMHYFYAEHFAQTKDTAKQMEHLSTAIEADPTDADVLIAMHRVAGADAEFRKKTSRLIREGGDKFMEQVEIFRRQVDEAQDEEFRQWASARLASLYNQYAWLIGNTEGDFDEAVRASHKSLELRPGTAGYLDTLGHCYFTKKDFANAVKYQMQAVKRDPHSVAIRRGLEKFERALAESQEPGQ